MRQKIIKPRRIVTRTKIVMTDILPFIFKYISSAKRLFNITRKIMKSRIGNAEVTRFCTKIPGMFADAAELGTNTLDSFQWYISGIEQAAFRTVINSIISSRANNGIIKVSCTVFFSM